MPTVGVLGRGVSTACRAQKFVMQQRDKYGVTHRAQVPRRSLDMRAAGEASPRRRELLGPASGVVANDCTTKLENAHETEFRELYIRGIRGPALASAFTSRVEEPDGVVFRCSVRGRRLEIPSLDVRSVCMRRGACCS